MSRASAGPVNTVLGFDFGTKRIGVAVGSTLLGTARPLTVLPTRDGAPDWEKITQLAQEWMPQRLVVGLPLNMDGSDSDITVQARSFARKLGGRLVLPVDTVDERLTSVAAHDQLMQASPAHNKSGRPEVDALAAALIVGQWLAQRATQG